MKWPTVALGDVLRPSAEVVDIDPLTEYKEVTVKLWGKGAVLRRLAKGSEIGATRRFKVKAGQFILSRIDARNGAFATIPDGLDGAVVSNDFPVFNADESKLHMPYLDWYSKTSDFVELCQRASEGTTNRVRLKEDRFMASSFPLPPLAEQRRLVAMIQSRAQSAAQILARWEIVRKELDSSARALYHQFIQEAPRLPMRDVAPLVRRPVGSSSRDRFPELGVRSFGKGTFHKPDLPALEVGSKKLFEIWERDLLFNIVFAWEGAVAVAKPEDHGRVGSHRFLSCVPDLTVALPEFLAFHFLTDEGIFDLGQASPGGAGRNRTLGIEKLANIVVPVPPLANQQRLVRMLAKANEIKRLQAESAKELDALLPSILHRAFRGEL